MASRLINAIKPGIQGLLPGYFALVMATGIVSIAAHLLAYETVARILLVINVAAYIILWLLLVLRLAYFTGQVAADLRDHLRSPGFFTLVAGTCVLGSQFVLLDQDMLTGGVLWGVGLVLWLGLIYAIFSLLMTKADKPPLGEGVNGTWLVAVVATQSLSVLGTLLAGSVGNYHETMLFFTLGMYLLGGVLYILIMAMIFYRLLFFPLSAAQLTPPYWISMGAVAITTLAGDTLIINASEWSFLGEILPFLKGLNLLFWVTATWWIPLLVILGAWRHLSKRYPLTYDPMYWSLVFPLGMYTVCTYQLAKALGFQWLYSIPRYFVFVALAAWLITLFGLVYRIVAGFTSPPVSTQES